MGEFHFSSRPNRASEIAWLHWGEEAFARAAAEDKPIILGISAVWCHWCHVMDETTYSDPDVIATIARDFVSVRVDNDERPDVNARYNMGGWPTTVFLAPDGSTLTGFTYVPPAQMRRALDEISHFFRENRESIAERTATMHPPRAVAPVNGADAPARETIDAVAQTITESYDAEYGGFGYAPKFPQPEVLEFLLHRWRSTNDATFFEMVARTMREMSRGGMYDHVEGGFFRYSTTRDWSVPHFEKMSEDHAGLLRVLSQLQLWAPHDDWRGTLESALRYVRSVLRDRATSLFAGSQDADEEYFALDLAGRTAHPAPYVDPRSYSNWTAALAGAFAWAATALDDDALAAESLATLDALHERARDGDGLLHHVLAPGEPPRIRGLLADQSAYLRALIDAYEHTGENRMLERAVACAAGVTRFFASGEGAFYDSARLEPTIGRLELRDRPIVENALMAESLLRLAVTTGEGAYRDAAGRALTFFADTYAQAGQFAAAWARALERFFAPEVSVKLAGPGLQSRGFRTAALRLPAPFVTLANGTAERTLAFVCRGTACAAPVDDPALIRAAYDGIAVETSAATARMIVGGQTP